MERTYKTPVEYTWTLDAEQPVAYKPERYEFGFAEPADAMMVAAVLVVGTRDEPPLVPLREELTRQTVQCIRGALRTSEMDYIVARRGTAIMAAAAVTSVPGKNGHLPGGICVLPEHRNRGVDRYLLYLALLWLREMGVGVARGYAEAGSVADRLTYPSFGGRRHGISYSRKRLERSRRAPTPTTGASASDGRAAAL